MAFACEQIPERKTRYTWEMIQIEGEWVGINTSNPNALAFEWIKGGKVARIGRPECIKKRGKLGRQPF